MLPKKPMVDRFILNGGRFISLNMLGTPKEPKILKGFNVPRLPEHYAPYRKGYFPEAQEAFAALVEGFNAMEMDGMQNLTTEGRDTIFKACNISLQKGADPINSNSLEIHEQLGEENYELMTTMLVSLYEQWTTKSIEFNANEAPSMVLTGAFVAETLGLLCMYSHFFVFMTKISKDKTATQKLSDVQQLIFTVRSYYTTKTINRPEGTLETIQ